MYGHLNDLNVRKKLASFTDDVIAHIDTKKSIGKLLVLISKFRYKSNQHTIVSLFTNKNKLENVI